MFDAALWLLCLTHDLPSSVASLDIPSILQIPNLLDSPRRERFVVMKTKLVLKAAVLIGVLALIGAGYCFWLMNVPLSYRWVPVVVIGFVAAIGVFIIALITSVISLMQLRRSPRTQNTP